MKKLILIICIAACSLTAASSYASDNHMSKEEFKSNCELSGGAYTEDGEYRTCYWPNGAVIVCDNRTCSSDNNGSIIVPEDNLPQYDPELGRSQSRYEGSTSYEAPTANEAESQRSKELTAEELSAMERLDKMESVIREKMYEDIFGK